MSRYLIVELSTKKVPKDDRINGMAIYDDALFLRKSDWGGDEVKDEGIALNKLKRVLKPVASVNIRKRTVTFKKKETVLKKYKKAIKDIFKKRIEELNKGVCSHSGLTLDIDEILGIEDIFYIDYCITAGDLLSEYINGYLPKKLYIGALLDGHY